LTKVSEARGPDIGLRTPRYNFSLRPYPGINEFGDPVLEQSRYSALIECVLCWCTSKACIYKKCNRNDIYDNFLLNYNVGCKEHTAYRTLMTSRFSQAVLQVSFTNKWWFWSKVEAWTKKKTFKTSQLNASRLFLCRLKSEHKCSGKSARLRHVLWMML